MKKAFLGCLLITIILITSYIVYEKIMVIKGENPHNLLGNYFNHNNQKIQKDNYEHNSIEKDKIIGNLKIKKINLDGPIKEGSSSKVLKDYIGHIEETPIYNGNVCLAAHNRGNKYSYFSRINELIEGDEIIYNTDIYTKHYKVTDIQEIDETDWKMLEDSSENKITLITCIKNKKDKRLCVQAVEI